MNISRLGEAPDYRFSLANERTFLAWIRTALGFLAAGVGLDQLAPDFATPLIREVLALLLCLIAGVLAIYGYLRWLRNEKAMRLKQDLPYTRGLLIISTILLMVAGVVMLLVLPADSVEIIHVDIDVVITVAVITAVIVPVIIVMMVIPVVVIPVNIAENGVGCSDPEAKT